MTHAPRPSRRAALLLLAGAVGCRGDVAAPAPATVADSFDGSRAGEERDVGGVALR